MTDQVTIQTVKDNRMAARRVVVLGLIRLIGVAGEGSGCFLTSSSKTVDSPTEAERGRNEP